MPLSTVAAVVGIAGGVNSIMQSNKGSGAAGDGNGAMSPWFASGGGSQAAAQLQQLMSGGPQSILQDKAFQGMNDASLKGVQRQMAAKGQGLSGNELIALQEQGNTNAMSFYNNQVQQLSSLAGVGFNPADGARINSANEQAGWQGLAQGIGGLNQVSFFPCRKDSI